jgi:predicted dienelactone hydrolase
VTGLSAAPPIETPAHQVGRRTCTIEDRHRPDRSIAMELWYPSLDDAPSTRYDLLPGVSFEAAHARHETTPLPGSWPLVVMSHGRTGMRIAYSLLCEALAARGAVVIAPDHAGDTLIDWLLGTHVDDRTNELHRIDDLSGVLDAVLRGDDALPPELPSLVDDEQVAVVGHSYGVHGALAAVAGRQGRLPEERIRAIVGLQPYTRLLSDASLSRVSVPVLLVGGDSDRTTPLDTDVDRALALLGSTVRQRVVLERAAHQAASDMGLYAELASHVDLPDIVRQYLDATTVDAVGEGLAPYRELIATQVELTWAFLTAAH